MKHLTTLFALLLHGISLCMASEPYFQHIGVPEGLAHPTVLSICQDSLGRIWFGTANGLSIYDGATVSSCRPYELRGGRVAFHGSSITNMVCDATGDVHFLADQEWMRCDARTDAIETVSEGPIWELFLRDGMVSTVRGVECIRYNPASAQIESLGELPFGYIFDYHVDRTGRHWLICRKGMYCTGEDGEWVQLSAIDDLRWIFESSVGDIWSGSNSRGLLRIRPDGQIIHYQSGTPGSHGLKSDIIRNVAEDPDGRIWIGTFQGLACYDPRTDSFSMHSSDGTEGSLTQSSVYYVFVDYDGVLWAGTYYGGVNYTGTRTSAFTFHGAGESPYDLSAPVIGHMDELSDGHLWICTEGGGVNVMDTSTGAVRQYGSTAGANIKWLCPSGDSRYIYLATNRQGVWRLDPVTGEKEQELRDDGDGCTPHSVVNIVERYGDSLILSTEDGIFVHSLSTRRDSLLMPSRGSVRYMHIAVREDELWAATSDVTVFDLTTMSIKARYPITHQGTALRPMRLLITPSERVYASTYGHGMFSLEGDNFVPVTWNSLNTCDYQLTYAGDSRIIVSGERGLQVIDTDSGTSLHTFLIGSTLPLDALVKECGLTVTRDGTVYAGGINGMVSFKIDGGIQERASGLYFSGISLDGNPVRAYDGSKVLSRIPAYQHQIRLRGRRVRLDAGVAARHHITRLNWPDYEWRLKGQDRNWRPVRGPEISIPDMTPGRYTLQLREATPGGSPESASLNIRVMPPLYASWWARVLYVMLASAVIWILLHTWRVRRESEQIVAAEKAEKQKAQEMNEFLTTVSHELRTPLTLIIAQIDSISRSFRLPPQVSHKMAGVIDQASQMNELVTELIDFRRYEQDIMKLSVAPTDVNLFVEDMAGKFSEMASGRGISLGVDRSRANPQVYMDVYQMQKVMRNLIFNAMKYTPSGGSVRLAVRISEDDRVEIHVRDTGIGISEEDCKHIFERFYQADAPAGESIAGSGIGLALVRDIVQKHGGTVSVSSNPGAGSDFTVSMLQGDGHFEGDAMVHVEDVAEHHMHTDRSASKDTIVIAEDNREMAGILQDIFSVKYNVYIASDGREALELTKIMIPDLVLSDVMMPRMDGLELCSAIKSNPATAGVPVVLLTAFTDAEKQLSGLQRGADDYISKPFRAKEIITRCNNIVSARRSAAGTLVQDADLSRHITGKEEKRFIDRVTAILESNLSNPELSVEMIADGMHMSRSSLYGHFRSVLGETPNDYITTFRLHKACEMLTSDKEVSIGMIAERLGFSSQQYFCRRFKSMYGVSPMTWRRTGGRQTKSNE